MTSTILPLSAIGDASRNLKLALIPSEALEVLTNLCASQVYYWVPSKSGHIFKIRIGLVRHGDSEGSQLDDYKRLQWLLWPEWEAPESGMSGCLLGSAGIPPYPKHWPGFRSFDHATRCPAEQYGAQSGVPFTWKMPSWTRSPVHPPWPQ